MFAAVQMNPRGAVWGREFVLGGVILLNFPRFYWLPSSRHLGKVILLLLLSLLLSACKTELYSGLNEVEANNMVSVLINNGLDADKERDKKGGGFSVLVGRSQVSLAVDTLQQHGLPRERFSRVDDIFQKDGLISSPLEERVRYIYALSEQVEETLSQIDGVITARVHVVLPENNPFADKVKPSSASVFIKYLPGSQLNEIKSQIKFIVEKSIEGLSYDKVSLVMLPAKLTYSSSSGGQWVSILGVRIAKSQVGTFRLMLWGLFALVSLLAGIVVYLLLREPAQDKADGNPQPGSGDVPGARAAGVGRSAVMAGERMIRNISKMGKQ